MDALRPVTLVYFEAEYKNFRAATKAEGGAGPDSAHAPAAARSWRDTPQFFFLDISHVKQLS